MTVEEAAALAARSVAREGLLRMMPFRLEQRDGEAEDDGRNLIGHAATFGDPTVIDSWEGRFTEEIAPGAFRKTFRERTPVLQFDHGTHPLLGSIPIGVVKEAREDDIGAFTRSRLHDNWLVQPVRDAISEGSISGMSFRFTVVREEWRDEEGKVIRDDESLLRLLWDESTDFPRRTLKELKVPELGPVVFPAYRSTDVAVRSEEGPTVIDLGALTRERSERVKLARSLFLAERASLGHNDSEGTPRADEDAPVPDEVDTPQAEEAAPVPVDQETQGRDAALLAAQMRATLNRINRR